MSTKPNGNFDVENSNDSFNQKVPTMAGEVSNGSVNELSLLNSSQDDSTAAFAEDGSEVSSPLDLSSSARVRNRKSKEQQRTLEEEFEKGAYVNPKRAVELAHKLNLTKQSVTMWFNNQRQKVGAQKKKWSPTVDQIGVLKQEYEQSKYLDRNRKKALAEKLKIDEKNLIRWFAMNRKKDKAQPSPVVRSVPDLTEGKAQSNVSVAPSLDDQLNGQANSCIASATDNNVLISSLMSCLDESTRHYYRSLTKIFCPELHSELSEIDGNPSKPADEDDELLQSSLCETIAELSKSSSRPKAAKRKRLSSKGQRRVSFSEHLANASPQDSEVDCPGVGVTAADSSSQPVESKPAKRKRLSKSRRVTFPGADAEDEGKGVPVLADDFSNSPISAIRRLSVANLSFSSDHDNSNLSDMNDTLPDPNNNNSKRENPSGKKKRTLLSDDQIAKLQEEFARNVRVDKKRTSELADELKVSSNYVENWFRKRRSEQNIKLNSSIAPDVKQRLQEEYAKSPALDKIRKKSLAEELNIKETAVYTYFYRSNKKDKESVGASKEVQ